MRYIYNVRKDILEIDEENHTVYGIDVIHNSAVVNIPPERIESAAAEILDSSEKDLQFTDICG